MAEETLQLVPYDSPVPIPVPYVVDFAGIQRQAAGIRHRAGRNALSGPVVLKIADGEEGKSFLRRELEVARYLRTAGGELLSKCLAYDFVGPASSALVTYCGQPLAGLVRDDTKWPLDHTFRTKLTTDLLRGLELLRISSIVHGAIGMDTLCWDGGTLQITDFGHAALRGKYPDGSPACHGDDMAAACRVIYQVYAGQPPPEDPFELRRQLQEVQDASLRDLLLRHDRINGEVYYAFDADPERRPTSRVLLDRLDNRPHGVQREQLLARDQAVRADFRQLRQRQQQFGNIYGPWAAQRAARRAARTWVHGFSWRHPAGAAPRPGATAGQAPGMGRPGRGPVGAGHRPSRPDRRRSQRAAIAAAAMVALLAFLLFLVVL